jgi:hypothetical protein
MDLKEFLETILVYACVVVVVGVGLVHLSLEGRDRGRIAARNTPAITVGLA